MNLLSNRSRHYHTEAFVDMVADINALGIDHMLCTGDVTNLAFRQEFEYARARFDGLTLPSTQVTVLPGNHDAYVPEGVLHFAEVFAPFITSDAAFSRATDNAGSADDLTWPLVRVHGTVAIVGLCTSRATPWFTAHGTIGAPQLARFDDVLTRLREAQKTVVVALHHPPAGRRAASKIRGLKDHAAFAEVIARHKVGVVVHGHEHRDMREQLATSTGTTEVLGVPSGTYEAGDPSRTGRYRILEIDDQGEIKHRLRVWHRNRRCFEDDAHLPS